MSHFRIRVGCDVCDAYAYSASPVHSSRLEEFKALARTVLLNNDLSWQTCKRSQTGFHIVRQTEKLVRP